jgi:hypothetical protein
MPWRFVDLFPKGKADCGSHEWYNAEPNLVECYFCEAFMQTAWQDFKEHGDVEV